MTDQKSLCSLTNQRLHTNWQQKALTKLMGLQYRIVYKKGADNRVADALSRRPAEGLEVLALSVVQPVWMQEIVHSYVGDSKASALLQQLAIAPGTHDCFTLQDGLLHYKNCIWVGDDHELQHKIIRAFHSTPVGGHSGFPVTYRRLLSLFRWSGMKAQVQNFVSTCQVCQQAKPERVLYPGKLQPLRVPSEAWHTIDRKSVV